MALVTSQVNHREIVDGLTVELEDPFDWDTWSKETEYLLGKQFEFECGLEESQITKYELFTLYRGLGRINTELQFYDQAIENFEEARKYSNNKANT